MNERRRTTVTDPLLDQQMEFSVVPLLSALRGWVGTSFGCRCFKVMERAAHYRDKANRALRLAEAAWQPELKDRLRSLAKDYEEIAEDIETGATEIRHPEILER